MRSIKECLSKSDKLKIDVSSLKRKNESKLHLANRSLLTEAVLRGQQVVGNVVCI